ncbi:uncharacterized protein METZ01_LOCUS316300, partial [marine metagenome]
MLSDKDGLSGHTGLSLCVPTLLLGISGL